MIHWCPQTHHDESCQDRRAFDGRVDGHEQARDSGGWPRFRATGFLRRFRWKPVPEPGCRNSTLDRHVAGLGVADEASGRDRPLAGAKTMIIAAWMSGGQAARIESLKLPTRGLQRGVTLTKMGECGWNRARSKGHRRRRREQDARGLQSARSASPPSVRP